MCQSIGSRILGKEVRRWNLGQQLERYFKVFIEAVGFSYVLGEEILYQEDRHVWSTGKWVVISIWSQTPLCPSGEVGGISPRASWSTRKSTEERGSATLTTGKHFYCKTAVRIIYLSPLAVSKGWQPPWHGIITKESWKSLAFLKLYLKFCDILISLESIYLRKRGCKFENHAIVAL